jgi:colicin import membrane protein
MKPQGEKKMADKAGKKQEKKEKGAQASAPSHKAGIVRTFGRLSAKKIRRAFKANGVEAAKKLSVNLGAEATFRSIVTPDVVARRQQATLRRRLNSHERSMAKLEVARAKHEAKRAAEAAAKLEAEAKAKLAAEAEATAKLAAEKKAKRSVAAKKAAATKAANKAAKLAAEAANDQTASV